MRRASLLVITILVTFLAVPVQAFAQVGELALRPVDGALITSTEQAHAESSTSEVTGLTLDGTPLDARPVFSGEPFAFVFEGNGLDVRYVNGIEVAGHQVYTLDGVSSWATEALTIEAAWLHPGENQVRLFTGARPGICNLDDFDVRNVRLRLPDGSEITDPAHPSTEQITLGDGTCGSDQTRPREVTYTFDIPADAGTGPLGAVADIDPAALADGAHDLVATTDGGAVTHTVWSDHTLTRPEEVEALLRPGFAAEQVIEAEDLLPPVAQDIAVAQAPNCCLVKFNGDAQLLAGEDTGAYDPPVDGSSFTVDVPVEATGRYHLAVDVTNAPEYGIFQLAINGSPIGQPYDAYAPALTVDRRASFGTVDLGTGIAQLTVTVTGANPASAGRMVGLDAIRLQPVPSGPDILSPADGAVVSGLVPVVGYTAEVHPRALTIDGTSPGARQLLGGESASLVFEGGGGNGLQGSFANRIEVRGQEFPIPGNVQDWTEDAVDIPSELLAPGENTVTFIAGLDSGCNHDDFDIRNVRLELADGTVLEDPTVAGQIVVFGDGTCDQTVGGRSRALEYDFTFVIPEPGDGVAYHPGLGTVWDTTAVPDGEHTVTLDHRDGTSTVNTVVVDNTAPEITGTVPAEGDTLKGTVTLAVAAADATSGIAATEVTIDDQPYQVGEALSSDDLTDGTHEMVVTVTDLGGNTTSQTVTFSSIAESPEVEILSPADGADDVSTAPTLEIRAVDPAGDPLTATFYPAQLGEPTADGAWNGSTIDLPADLDSTAEDPIADVTGAIRPDGAYLDSPDTGETPFQRFDLPVPEGGSDLEINWEGRIDHAREIVLSAYDLAAGEWRELARRRGDSAGDVRLRVPVTEEFVDGGTVHVLLAGHDPFADDIVDAPDEQFRDPDTYDFAIAWMTDTQYLSEGAVGGGPADYRFAAAYRDMTDWIVEQADDLKIDYVAHTGDIINNWITIGDESEGYEQRARREFGFASETMAVLEEAGIPYGVTPGNHDNKFGTTNELFNEFFPPSRFETASRNAEQEYFGGSWRDGDYHNHYDLFTAGGVDFIVVYLGFIADEDEIQWANDVLREHSDRNAIFATHEYLMPSLEPDGRDGPLSNENERSQGIQLFEQVVLPNENVFLVLSGHTHGVALNIKRNVGTPGRTVVEMLANYQFYELGGQRRTGHLRLLQFDLDRSELSVNTYSPTLDDHNAEEFDTDLNRDYTAAADEFTVPVDLTTRTTQFGTDAVYLAARGGEPIGTVEVGERDTATMTWNGLEPGTRYGWYAAVDDGRGGVTESATATFTTSPVPGWRQEAVYTAGDRVVWDGKLWEAAWWTQGDEPGANPHGPWQEIAPPGENGIAPWTGTRIYHAGDVVSYDGVIWEAQWWTRGDEPGAERWGPWRRVDG